MKINYYKILFLIAAIVLAVVFGGRIKTNDKILKTLKINRIKNNKAFDEGADNVGKIKLPSVNNIYEAR